MTLAIDGSGATGTSSGTASVSATITTSLAADIIVAYVFCEKPSGTQVTVSGVSGGGLTWALRKQFTWVPSGQSNDIEIWWAAAASALSAQTITASLTGTVDNASLHLIAVSGVPNQSSPWDTNVSLPAAGAPAGSVTNTPSTTISTTSTTTLVLGFWGIASTVQRTAGTGFTALYSTSTSSGTLFTRTFSEYQTFASAQSNTTVNFNGTGGIAGGGYIFDALSGAAGTTAYSLAAAEGTYALAGQAQTLTLHQANHYSLAAAEGSYALSGQAASLAFTGGAAFALQAAGGTYALSGQAPSLVVTGGAAFTLAAAEGTYGINSSTYGSGGYGSGTYGEGAGMAALVLSRAMAAAEGTYSLTGEVVSFRQTRGLMAASGVYGLTGNPQVLRQAGFGAVRGAYALTGQPVTLAVGLNATQGSYALSGKTVAFPVHLSLMAASGSYIYTGFSPSGGAGSGPPFAGRHSQEFIADAGRTMTISEQK